jgi:hypothetical protein
MVGGLVLVDQRGSGCRLILPPLLNIAGRGYRALLVGSGGGLAKFDAPTVDAATRYSTTSLHGGDI